MFRDHLRRIAHRIGNVVALTLVARDGIAVETFNQDPELDLEALAAELVAQLRVISENQKDLKVGEVQHLAITTEKLTVMVSAVAHDYYLLLVLGEQGNQGRARFELRRARLQLESELI